jgi:hypothetical protein
MKIRNDDLVKLNELKLDFLSPSYSFRLANITAAKIDATINVMKQYVTEDNGQIQQLQALKSQIESDTTDMQSIKKLCKEAAAIITYFTAV